MNLGMGTRKRFCPSSRVVDYEAVDKPAWSPPSSPRLGVGLGSDTAWGSEPA